MVRTFSNILLLIFVYFLLQPNSNRKRKLFYTEFKLNKFKFSLKRNTQNVLARCSSQLSRFSVCFLRDFLNLISTLACFLFEYILIITNYHFIYIFPNFLISITRFFRAIEIHIEAQLT